MAGWYTCKDGDELDSICKDVYGYSRGSTEAVLAHDYNRELAEKLPILEVGDEIYLPDLAPPTRENTTSTLWG